MKRCLLLTAAVALLAAAPAPKPADRPDEERLRGTWVLAAVVNKGHLQDIPPEAQTLRWEFDAGTIHVAGPTERKPGTYTLDPAHHALDLSLAGGAGPIRAFYLINGDTLQVCIDNDDAARRPDSFTTRATNRSLMVFQRQRADDPRVLAAQKELQRLEGAWELIGVERKGKPERIGKVEYVFKGRQITLLMDGKPAGTVTFLFDPGTSPRHITLPSGDAYVPSIYVLEGDTLKICSAGSGENRPTTFTTTPDSGRMLTVLKRKKP